MPFIDFFYDSTLEKEDGVRRMWYIYCYHFLPKINKEWCNALHSSRLRKKTFIFDYITTSDEAMTRWFLKIWEPKIKEQWKNKWPIVPRSYGDGEHELKAGLKDYI